MRSEVSSKRFLGETSDKAISSQYLRPKFHPIYQQNEVDVGPGGTGHLDWYDLQ